MGKKSRLRQERRARREAMKPQVQEWSKIPEEALSGPCREPTCTLPRCLDPWVTVLELHNKDYDGPVVMICYSVDLPDGGGERRLRVNGEDVAVVPPGKLLKEDPAAHQLATKTLIDAMHQRFGAGAPMAVVSHLARGAELTQTHHGKRGEA